MKQFDILNSSHDQAMANWITAKLEATGEYRKIQSGPGSNFVLKAHTANHILILLSPSFLAEFDSHPEWSFVFDLDPASRKQLLIPIKIAFCNAAGLLRAILPLDLTDLDEEEAREVLLAGLSEKRQKPAGPPPFPGR